MSAYGSGLLRMRVKLQLHGGCGMRWLGISYVCREAPKTAWNLLEP